MKDVQLNVYKLWKHWYADDFEEVVGEFLNQIPKFIRFLNLQIKDKGKIPTDLARDFYDSAIRLMELLEDD